jgi:hypothetical protein
LKENYKTPEIPQRPDLNELKKELNTKSSNNVSKFKINLSEKIIDESYKLLLTKPVNILSDKLYFKLLKALVKHNWKVRYFDEEILIISAHSKNDYNMIFSIEGLGNNSLVKAYTSQLLIKNLPLRSEVNKVLSAI